MKRRAMTGMILLAVSWLAVGLASGAERIVEPKPGNPLRKAVLDGLRGPVQRDLGCKVIFVVDELRVSGGWAFASVRPVNPDSSPIDFRKTRYREQIEEGCFDGSQTYALLKKSGDDWKTVTFVIGPTDVAWADWPREYGVSAKLCGLPAEYDP